MKLDWTQWTKTLRLPEKRNLTGTQILSWLEDNFYPGWRIGAAAYLQSWLLEKRKPLFLKLTKDDDDELELDEAVCANWPQTLSEIFINEYRLSADYRSRYGNSHECVATARLRKIHGNDYVAKLIDRVVDIRSAA